MRQTMTPRTSRFLERLEVLDGRLAECVSCTIYTETYLQTILLGRRTLLWSMV